MFNVLDRSTRKRTFLSAHRSQAPFLGDEFILFNPDDLNDRSIIYDNATIVLRSMKLQTVTVEKPILGLKYRRRLELKMLGADVLGNKQGYGRFPGSAKFNLRIMCA